MSENQLHILITSNQLQRGIQRNLDSGSSFLVHTERYDNNPAGSNPNHCKKIANHFSDALLVSFHQRVNPKQIKASNSTSLE